MLKLIKNIVIFTAVFIVAMFFLDMFIKYASINPVSIYSYDPKIGRTLRSDIEYLYTSEGLSAGATNQYGYLGKGYPKEKEQGVVRIALLGDSYVEGFQLFDRHHFRSIMEKELKEKYGINAEVMNYGRSGFDLTDMYTYYTAFVSQFNPDIVLYFTDNGDYAPKPNEAGMPYPYIENDSLKMFYYTQDAEGLPWFLSMNKMSLISPTVQILRNSINLYKKGETLPILLGKFYEPFIEQQPVPSSHPPGELQKKILQSIAASPNTFIVNRDKKDMESEISTQLKTAEVNVIDLNEALYPLSQSGINPYLWKYSGKEGHWNHKAHEVVGKYLAEKISSVLKGNN